MIKEFDFQCKSCGATFDDYVEVEVGSKNTIKRMPKCPRCESVEVERIMVNAPAHSKHSSWRV